MFLIVWFYFSRANRCLINTFHSYNHRQIESFFKEIKTNTFFASKYASIVCLLKQIHYLCIIHLKTKHYGKQKIISKSRIFCECCGKIYLKKILWEFSCYMVVAKSKIIKWKRCLSKSILLLQKESGDDILRKKISFRGLNYDEWEDT